MKRIIALAVVALAACQADPIAPKAPTLHSPSLGVYDATRPAPANVSAVLIGTDAVGGIDSVQVTFTDNAEGEALVSAYFLPTATLAAATQNIGGTAAASGVRTAVIVVEAGHAQVELRNLWSADLSDPAQNIWGPFSEIAPVTGSVAIAATVKGKRHR